MGGFAYFAESLVFRKISSSFYEEVTHMKSNVLTIVVGGLIAVLGFVQGIIGERNQMNYIDEQIEAKMKNL